MYNPPFGAILPFGLHKGGGLAVICDLLAGALTGGKTHRPRTIKGRHRHRQQHAVDHHRSRGDGRHPGVRGRGRDLHHLGEVGQAAAGRREVLAPGEPERARKVDREKNGVPIDGTTWQQLIEVAPRCG